MRLDRVLGAVLSIAGLAITALFTYAISIPNPEKMVGLAYPYIAFGILLLFAGLYFLGRQTDSNRSLRREGKHQEPER